MEATLEATPRKGTSPLGASPPASTIMRLVYSLLSLTTGNFNTATGAGTLLANTADQNTATGAGALLSNTTGPPNTANGAFALFSNTEGFNNTATGDSALASNTIGKFNTAHGFKALFSNTEGFNNTAVGVQALLNNSNQDGNTAIGSTALFANTTGGFNTAIGRGALGNSVSGSENTALGELAGVNVTTASNVICIGAVGADVSNTCFIGHIFGVTTQNANAIPVLVDNVGQLGTQSSSRRFKKEIKPMDQTSEAILALKPVTFQYKSDATNTPKFGLLAEEVAEVNPDLVVRDENGEIYTVRYDAVNAMLLNEFLKEHRKVEEQQAMITELKSTALIQEASIAKHEETIADMKEGMAVLTAQFKEQEARIQKVSARIEVIKPVPQMAENNP